MGLKRNQSSDIQNVYTGPNDLLPLTFLWEVSSNSKLLNCVFSSEFCYNPVCNMVLVKTLSPSTWGLFMDSVFLQALDLFFIKSCITLGKQSFSKLFWLKLKYFSTYSTLKWYRDLTPKLKDKIVSEWSSKSNRFE